MNAFSPICAIGTTVSIEESLESVSSALIKEFVAQEIVNSSTLLNKDILSAIAVGHKERLLNASYLQQDIVFRRLSKKNARIYYFLFANIIEIRSLLVDRSSVKVVTPKQKQRNSLTFDSLRYRDALGFVDDD